MTKIITFIFESMAYFYKLAVSLKFDFFGYQVSVFEILIGFSIIMLIVNFFRLFTMESYDGAGISLIKSFRLENLKDKRQENREIRTIRSGARHAKYTGPRHSRRWLRGK